MQHENILALSGIPNPTIRIDSETLLLAEHIRDEYPDDWSYINDAINRLICEQLLDHEYYKKRRKHGITR